MIHDECTRIAYEAGTLRLVTYRYDVAAPKEINGIRLLFQHGDWIITVNEDDDTIELKPAIDRVLEAGSTIEASSFFPWAAAIGKSVRWAWTLQNQQGYLDALQFEFADPNHGGSVGIQVVAVASRLAVHAVVPLETPYLATHPAS